MQNTSSEHYDSRHLFAMDSTRYTAGGRVRWRATTLTHHPTGTLLHGHATCSLNRAPIVGSGGLGVLVHGEPMIPYLVKHPRRLEPCTLPFLAYQQRV